MTAFTLSDFGRTLQPSGSGSDHGWGNHHLILGGAVNGGRIYGRFPLMTNYANFNATQRRLRRQPRRHAAGHLAVAVRRHAGASGSAPPMRTWTALFPTLPNFTTRDLGFMS